MLSSVYLTHKSRQRNLLFNTSLDTRILGKLKTSGVKIIATGFWTCPLMEFSYSCWPRRIGASPHVSSRRNKSHFAKQYFCFRKINYGQNQKMYLNKELFCVTTTRGDKSL